MKNLNSITHENCEELVSLTLRTKFFETIKNARKKLETSVAPAMPCKISKNNQNCGNGDKSKKIKSKLACILEASEFTRLRMENLYRIIMKTVLQEKETSHCSIAIWFTNLSLWSKPQQRQQWTRNGTKFEKISAWNLTKVRTKKEVIDEARTKGAKIHFASLMDICHLKNAELEAKHQKYKGRVVLRGDIVKDDSGSYAVFTEQGSSASQMTAAKVMDIISRLPGCDGQAADAVPVFPR